MFIFIVFLFYFIVENRCEGYSGADLAALVREAGICALRRILGSTNASAHALENSNLSVQASDFQQAFKKVLPSVNKQDLERYRGLAQKLRAKNSHLNDD